MKKSALLNVLVPLVGVLALVGAACGLFWQDGGTPYSFTTLHGQKVFIYGQGLYRYDSFFKAPIFRGTDAVTLFVCLPLLAIAFGYYRRDSLKGGLLLSGILSFFLYNSASMAFGAAYNPLFLLYVLFFSASLFAFILAFTAVDLSALPARVLPHMPHRPIAIFLLLASLSVFVWLIDIITALAQHSVPQGLAGYTTDITTVIDIGIITPSALLAAYGILHRAPLGYLLAATMLVLNAIIGMVVLAQTIAQRTAGIFLSSGQMFIYVGIFVTMSVVATGLTVALFRNITPNRA
jgi:hypothetical protein